MLAQHAELSIMLLCSVAAFCTFCLENKIKGGYNFNLGILIKFQNNFQVSNYIFVKVCFCGSWFKNYSFSVNFSNFYHIKQQTSIYITCG